MRYTTILATVVLLNACRGQTAQEGASTLKECGLALAGCADVDDKGLYRNDDVGHMTPEEVDDMSKQYWSEAEARKQRAEAERQASLTYNKKYAEFVSSLTPDNPTDFVSTAPFGTPGYWKDYIDSVTSFFRAQKQQYGQLSPFNTHVAQDLAEGVVKYGNSLGQDVTVESITMTFDDVGTTANGNQKTTSTTDTYNINVAPGGVGGGASSQSGSSTTDSKTVTHKDNDLAIHVRVTFNGRDGFSVPQELVFKLADAEPTTPKNFFLGDHESHAGDRSEIRSQQEAEAEAKREAAAAEARNAETKQRLQEIEESYKNRISIVVDYMYSDLDGKYHSVTPEAAEAYDFLNYGWRASADGRGSNLAAATARFKTLAAELDGQRRISEATIKTVRTRLSAETLTAADFADIKANLDGNYGRACSQEPLEGKANALRAMAAELSGLAEKAKGSIESIRYLQDVTHIEKIVEDDQRIVAAAEAAVADAVSLLDPTKHCQEFGALYAAVGLKAQQQATAARAADVRTILAKIADDLRQEAQVRAQAATLAQALAAARQLAVLLEKSYMEDDLAAAQEISEMIETRKDATGSSPEVVKVYTGALAAWDSYRDQAGPGTMVASRSKQVNDDLAAARRAVLGVADETKRTSIWNAWIHLLADEGVALQGECLYDKARFLSECWSLQVPPTDASYQRLVLFSGKLPRISRAAMALSLEISAAK